MPGLPHGATLRAKKRGKIEDEHDRKTNADTPYADTPTRFS
jgi:hypothetical protein